MIEELEELEESAEQELKRVDHLIFVTLKYTRTADVIKNTIKRLIAAFDFTILEALQFLKKKKKLKKIKTVQKLERLRAEQISETKIFPDIKEYIDFYFLLKKIDQAEFTKREEYRKNVTLMAIDKPGTFIEVNMATLREYYEKTKEFVELVEEMIHGKKE